HVGGRAGGDRLVWLLEEGDAIDDRAVERATRAAGFHGDGGLGFEELIGGDGEDAGGVLAQPEFGEEHSGDFGAAFAGGGPASATLEDCLVEQSLRGGHREERADGGRAG